MTTAGTANTDDSAKIGYRTHPISITKSTYT
jgi:hypothetical protein